MSPRNFYMCNSVRNNSFLYIFIDVRFSCSKSGIYSRLDGRLKEKPLHQEESSQLRDGLREARSSQAIFKPANQTTFQKAIRGALILSL